MATRSTKKVKSEDSPVYFTNVDIISEDQIIKKAIAILESRIRKSSFTFSSPQEVFDYLELTTNNDGVECFRILWLDSQHKLIETDIIGKGTIDACSVYPREIIKRALEVNAKACILSHNHPSGNTIPSNADRSLTTDLKNRLDIIEVKVLDHIITGSVGSAYSFAQKGDL